MASRPLVRGVRHNIQGNESNFALQQPFVNGVKEVGRRGLHFELCLTHDQLAETIDLVKLCPDTSFVLDHCAKPGIRDGGKEPWLTDMKNLAALPNVVCKISGLLTEADWEHWTQEGSVVVRGKCGGGIRRITNNVWQRLAGERR